MQRGVRRATRPVKLSAHAAPRAVLALSVPLRIPLRVPLVAVVPASCPAPPPTLVPIPIPIPAPPSPPTLIPPLIPAPPLPIPVPVATPVAVPVPPPAHVPGPTPIPVSGPVPVALHFQAPAPIHVPPSIRRSVSAGRAFSAHVPIARSPLVPFSGPVPVPPAVLPRGPPAAVVGVRHEGAVRLLVEIVRAASLAARAAVLVPRTRRIAFGDLHADVSPVQMGPIQLLHCTHCPILTGAACQCMRASN